MKWCQEVVGNDGTKHRLDDTDMDTSVGVKILISCTSVITINGRQIQTSIRYEGLLCVILMLACIQ